ncbi:2Fe-2S ferredoxin-like protein [Paraneptunicella aestuarii]|uniref:class I ribonucleotide reductase maintenance protein YfaE n=1 Tax=Paraneptunicella aestuarii TaxID=2831148 RepID=UPI001E47BE69|nr:class I ribonucleotide reductase maintenance protein YfaE [Paraneptunicella aestuarii]UAA40342.1 2Fe-2S ferredoxin-like protein [Paraneptunicella aestuarii]
MSDPKETLLITINSQQAIEYSSGETVLECLENRNIEVQYHCREGFCGACRTRLKQGEVEYKIAPLAYVDDDEILPCCCVPKTNIEIEVE